MTTVLAAKEFLPLDVQINIISRLPVKTLFRYKCVCKSWYTTISSSHFASLHLRNYTNNPATGDSLLCMYYGVEDEQVEDGRVSVYMSPDDGGIAKSIGLGDFEDTYICCDFGGFFLLRTGTMNQPTGYSLWNPATCETFDLPDLASRILFSKPPVFHDDTEVQPTLSFVDDNYGFGLDLVANEIKVVLLRNYHLGYKSVSQVLVYSLGVWFWWEHSWFLNDEEDNEDEEDDEISLGFPACNSFIFRLYYKGSYYWFSEYYPRMVSFDMGTNEFHVIRCPFFPKRFVYEDEEVGDDHSSLGLYHDKVAVFRGRQRNSVVDIWLLQNDDGQDWGWVKHVRLGPSPEMFLVERCWNKDQFLALSLEGELVLIDSASHEVKVVIPDCLELEGLFVYKETLVSINKFASEMKAFKSELLEERERLRVSRNQLS